MTVTSLLLVFVHYTYIKVSFVSVSSLPSRCVDPSGKRKRKNQVFCSVFFSSHSFSILIKNAHTPILHHHHFPSFLIYIYIIFSLNNQRKKPRRTDRQPASKEEEEKRTRKTLMIWTNSIGRKDEQERHFWDIVVFSLVLNKKITFLFFSLSF